MAMKFTFLFLKVPMGRGEGGGSTDLGNIPKINNFFLNAIRFFQNILKLELKFSQGLKAKC